MRSYKTLADSLLKEKIAITFPDWQLEKVDIHTGYVLLSNSNAKVELNYIDGVFGLISVTILSEADSLAVMDNEKLNFIHASMTKAGLEMENEV